MLVRSPSVWMSMTGASWSVRKIVGPAPERVGDADRLARPDEREAGAAAAVDEEGVEGLRQRLHAVVVGDHRERRLRLAGGDDPLGPQAAERVAGPERPADLGVDVERVAVTRVLERAVARRVDLLETHAGLIGAGHALDLHGHRAALDADQLGRHAHPGVAGSRDLLLQVRPLGLGVDAAADVEPLDDDRPAELRLLLRRAHDDAGPVRRRAVGRERPAPVVRLRRPAVL